MLLTTLPFHSFKPLAELTCDTKCKKSHIKSPGMARDSLKTPSSITVESHSVTGSVWRQTSSFSEAARNKSFMHLANLLFSLSIHVCSCRCFRGTPLLFCYFGIFDLIYLSSVKLDGMSLT